MAGRPPSEVSIGALAARTGCKAETIRYYERIGILPPPPRTPGGQRRYRRAHLMRLNFIRRARELGFALDEVRALLRLVDEGGHSCAEVETLARGHLDSVRVRIADLAAMEAVLAHILARCAGGTVPDCPIIEALFQEPAAA
jgi:MerR family mercuric resistance operon transcriptional regulator